MPNFPVFPARFHFIHRAPPKPSLSQSLADTLGGTVSQIRTVEGNFASGPFDLTLTVPDGFLFYPQVCGIQLTTTDSIGSLGQVRFGTPVSLARFVAATFATITADNQNEEWLVRSTTDRKTGFSELSAGLATSGSLTQALGYFYFKGVMVRL